MHNYTSFRPQKQGISSKNKDFFRKRFRCFRRVDGWLALFSDASVSRHRDKRPIVFCTYLTNSFPYRRPCWTNPSNVSLPFSAPLISSAVHAHLCLFTTGGRQWKKPGNIFHVYCVYFFAIFPYAYHWGGFRQMIRCGVSTKEGRGSPAGRQPHLYAGGIQKTAGGDLSAWLTL